MHPAPARSAPIGAYLAIAAGALALVALALPWFSLDAVAFQEAFQRVMRQISAAGGAESSLVDSASGQAFAQMAADRAATKINAGLHGYQDSIVWVAVRVATVIGAVLAGLRICRGEVTGASQRGAFIGIGVAFAIRPAMNLMNNPFTAYDGQDTLFGLNPSELVAPASGIYVALAAAALMVLAGLLAHVGDEVAVSTTSAADASPSGAAAPGGAYAPVPAVGSAHVPRAYVPPGLPSMAAVAAAPAPYVPGPGPSRRGPSPYAPAPMRPQPQAAPQAYVPGGPGVGGPGVGGPGVGGPAPVRPAMPAMAAPPPVPAAQRTGSVAPPGLF